ncbi:ATP-binding cassette domain-containing protein [Acetobacteraceae bacterium KSS8]|uniref:ATP-binding cassette domain-containing protein n=1 Tax=Endosaccharibacter trunci TaxID=2812733 RepID=A0ABT1W8V6_9PROT|nr:ATP-binding cassette domain-containing protein [Acetobacteraceae bacterium KSS8]
MTPLLAATGLFKSFGVPGRLGRRTRMMAVNGASLTIGAGETVGLVGESGSGKSTLGRLLLRLLDPDDGRIVYDGQDITHLSDRAMRPLRRDLQAIFQDPGSALNPRLTAGAQVAEPLLIHEPNETRGRRHERVAELFRQVGLDPSMMLRHPDGFSGGQRQRLCIARALATRPRLLIADEPITALDLSIQAQVLSLLESARAASGLTMLFISHDLAVVRYLCQRVVVMFRGQVIEHGPTEAVFTTPSHPYTQRLVASVFGENGEARRDPFLASPRQEGCTEYQVGADHFVLANF